MELTKFVRARDEKCGLVIFETMKENVFVSNDTGKEIFNLVQEGKSSKEIIEILKESYDADEKIIAEEVEEFLSKLKENNILVKKE